MYSKKSKRLLKYARENRTDASKTEILMWAYLRNKHLGVKFRRQYVFDKYILDFYCHKPKICIEVDDDSHDGKIEYDQSRDDYLQSFGIEVFRFSDSEVVADIEGIISTIEEFIQTGGRIDE